MAVKSVRSQLRQAAEDIDEARETTTVAATEEYLSGIEELLDYYVEGDASDPEAHVYPPPGALDTIQHRLTEVMDDTDDATAEHLQNARSHLLEVIMTLDKRLKEDEV